MSTTTITVLICILLIGFALAGIGIKILTKKGGRFYGSCASNNPFLRKDGMTCPACGAKPEEECKKK
ncbi:MAG: membrane or secreted protein [Bacteroidetes bacterium]|nr:membrane or secreted protein [Bacteroidota bacterium]